MVESITEDDLNRFVDFLNLGTIKTEEDLVKTLDSYSGKTGQGGFRLPFEFFQSIREKWASEIEPMHDLEELQTSLKEFDVDVEDLPKIEGISRAGKPRRAGIKGVPKPATFKLKEYKNRQKLFREYKNEIKRGVPKEKRMFRRREVNGKPVFEAKVRGKWYDFRRVRHVPKKKFSTKERGIVTRKEHYRIVAEPKPKEARIRTFFQPDHIRMRTVKGEKVIEHFYKTKKMERGRWVSQKDLVFRSGYSYKRKGKNVFVPPAIYPKRKKGRK